jgi:mevalonate pyrophosphate decarboxylase
LFGNDGFTQSMGEADTQTMAEGITQATAASLAVMDSDSKKVSQRTASYTTEEDKLLYNAWIEISQDPL